MIQKETVLLTSFSEIRPGLHTDSEKESVGEARIRGLKREVNIQRNSSPGVWEGHLIRDLRRTKENQEF